MPWSTGSIFNQARSNIFLQGQNPVHFIWEEGPAIATTKILLHSLDKLKGLVLQLGEPCPRTAEIIVLAQTRSPYKGC